MYLYSYVTHLYSVAKFNRHRTMSASSLVTIYEVSHFSNSSVQDCIFRSFHTCYSYAFGLQLKSFPLVTNQIF